MDMRSTKENTTALESHFFWLIYELNDLSNDEIDIVRMDYEQVARLPRSR